MFDVLFLLCCCFSPVVQQGCCPFVHSFVVKCISLGCPPISRWVHLTLVLFAIIESPGHEVLPDDLAKVAPQAEIGPPELGDSQRQGYSYSSTIPQSFAIVRGRKQWKQAQLVVSLSQ